MREGVGMRQGLSEVPSEAWRGVGHQGRAVGGLGHPVSLPCPPPTGYCRTGWAAGRPRAARRPSTDPAGPPKGRQREPQQTGRRPPLWHWSPCRWLSRQDRLGGREPGGRRRPGAAAAPGPTARPRPAAPSERPAGPPAAPAAAVGVAAAGGQSRWGRPGPAGETEGVWARAGTRGGG